MQGWLSDAIRDRQVTVTRKAQTRRGKAKADCVAEHNRLVVAFRRATGQTDPKRTW